MQSARIAFLRSHEAARAKTLSCKCLVSVFVLVVLLFRPALHGAWQEQHVLLAVPRCTKKCQFKLV